ncbi:MAG: DUF1343 domain-containing protein [Chitinophagales bacterium]|nr:DUF1343 domain-containing protein [Chitinophagales bacterium]MDW8419877.1 DUF1343 domain-containing protein [Chitinophagales bacterium]
MSIKNYLFWCGSLLLMACAARQSAGVHQERALRTGAEQTEQYLPLLKDKRVALVVNHTSRVGDTHLVDLLAASGVSIRKIFAPEHGFRGMADAGEHVRDTVDGTTGAPVISLYGEKKKPTAEDLKDVDVVVFDMQDVGARFYTYLSTLHYVMEACAEHNKELIVLDRPNPNGWYVDGPVLKPELRSFVGVAPIPVVHGLTLGEYARMANGEKWLKGELQCRLTVIPCLHYTHKMRYSLPVKPSPNLPNDVAVYLYPSLCFFEGTDISVARGTDFPFQAYGSPKITLRNFSFIPRSVPGARRPPHENRVCFGFDLRRMSTSAPGIQLNYLLTAYRYHSDTASFFLKNNFFDKLAGNTELRRQITGGKTEQEIRASWQADLAAYKEKRRKYLLYEDFE